MLCLNLFRQTIVDERREKWRKEAVVRYASESTDARRKRYAYQRAYRAAHREQRNAASRAHYDANPGKSGNYQQAWADANIEKYLTNVARKRARSQRLPFTIEWTDIVVPEFCPVFPWIKLARAHGRAEPSSPSLDRIIPALGYVPGNVRVISFRANELRRDGNAREFSALTEDSRAIDSGGVPCP